MKTLLMIDGENLKGKLKAVFKETGKDKPIWHQYDFKGLFDKVLNGITIDEITFYFARIKEHEKSKIKSKQLTEEQRLLKTHLEKQGFKVILSGRVRGQMEEGQNGKYTLVFREKGVDVKIAVDIVSLSCDKKVKEIILCSSDSDLQPAILEAKNRKVECVYLGFEMQPNKGISYTTNRTILIRNSEVLEFELIKKDMKTILIDAVDCFVSANGEIFKEMFSLLETYKNNRIIVTGANDEQFKKFGLDKMPYQVFTLKHDPEKTDPRYFEMLLIKFNIKKENIIYFEHNIDAVKSAQSIGINSYFYDNDKKDLIKLKEFLDKNLK